MKKKGIEWINITISIVLILSIGVLSGYCLGYFRASANQWPEIKWVEDTNQGVSTIKFLEVVGGELKGEVVGEKARLAYNGDAILELEPDSAFSIPLNQIYLQDFYQAREVPDGALFVASSQGKYYYSVFDKRAFTISEKNRVYFESEAEAEKRGYLKR